jgi:uncharacterized protein YprB with RNaseH-like and TPR domain
VRHVRGGTVIREAAAHSAKLLRQLAEISRRRAAGESLPPFSESGDSDGAAAEITRTEVGIEDILPGGVLEGMGGPVFLHERLRSSVERPQPGWGRLHRSRRRGSRVLDGLGPPWMWEEADDPVPSGEETEAGSAEDPAARQSVEGAWEDLAPEVLHLELERLLRLRFDRVVFLDLETGGLGSACVFLAGTMRWNGEDYVLRQYFARHYGEEGGLLDQVSRSLTDAEALVTFNGKSFDVPMLRDRALRHRVDLRLPELHVDLLHHSRAAWRGKVPNCRLTTLEAYVCRRRRVGDVNGDEVPGLYHSYVRDGRAHRLIPIFHHNLLDVITMDELLRRLI